MIDAFLLNPVAQGVGFAGTVGGALWPLFRGRSGMLLAQLATNLCFTAHYALLGAGTGAAMNLLSSLQVAAAIPLGTRPRFRIAYLAVLPLVAAALALTWNGLPSVFAALGMTLISVARYQTDVRLFRLAMAVALPCWFAHNLLVGSLPGMLSDATGLALNLAMMAGMRRRPAAQPTP